MNILSMCNETITIERKEDGVKYENVPALFSKNIIFIPAEGTPITPDDTVVRNLPSGITEKFIITEPNFQASNHGMPAHYQAKYRRDNPNFMQRQASQSSVYHVQVNGNDSRVNINSNDLSTNVNDQHLQKLTDELSKLREALLCHATTPDHCVALRAVSSAEIAAKSNDMIGLKKALCTLGSAAKWVINTAKDIGVPLVVEMLKHQV